MKRPRIREQDEAIAREQADHRREELLARMRAQEAAYREPVEPADVPVPDDPAAPAATERPPDT